MISKVLIIAGMHRSGTSLTTQWLHRCGLFIGKKLLPGNVGNIEGHFEDSDFLELHEKFLLKRNHPSTGFTHKPVHKLTVPEKQQIKNMIENKSRENKEWGWKEPRTCLFLDAYGELIPSAYYLIIVRDYHSTVSSMLSREYNLHIRKFQTKRGLSRIKWVLFKKKTIEEIFEKNAEPFLKIWIHYYEKILDHIRLLPSGKYMLVSYSYLFQKDKDIFARLTDEWHFSLHYFPFMEVFKKDLLSEVKNIEQYINDKELIKKAKGIEQLMNSLLLNGHDNQDER